MVNLPDLSDRECVHLSGRNVHLKPRICLRTVFGFALGEMTTVSCDINSFTSTEHALEESLTPF